MAQPISHDLNSYEILSGVREYLRKTKRQEGASFSDAVRELDSHVPSGPFKREVSKYIEKLRAEAIKQTKLEVNNK